jgi:hypothetical protein
MAMRVIAHCSALSRISSNSTTWCKNTSRVDLKFLSAQLRGSLALGTLNLPSVRSPEAKPGEQLIPWRRTRFWSHGFILGLGSLFARLLGQSKGFQPGGLFKNGGPRGPVVLCGFCALPSPLLVPFGACVSPIRGPGVICQWPRPFRRTCCDHRVSAILPAHFVEIRINRSHYSLETILH